MTIHSSTFICGLQICSIQHRPTHDGGNTFCWSFYSSPSMAAKFVCAERKLSTTNPWRLLPEVAHAKWWNIRFSNKYGVNEQTLSVKWARKSTLNCIVTITTVYREIRTLEKCVKDYMSRCLDGETRNSMSVVIYGISRTNKGYCSGTKKKNAFISFGDCANASKKMLEKHMATLTRDFHSAKLAKDPKLRLPYACCSYYRFKLSIVSAMDKRCPKETLEVENLLDGYARDGSFLLGKCQFFSNSVLKSFIYRIKFTVRW